VSHELRTPLTLIINPVSELLKKERLKVNVRTNLELVEKNARLLYRHVSDLLDISKLEAKQMTLHYSRFNITVITRLITSYFESLAATNHIHYSIHLPKELIVEIDAEKYHRILQNILSNAFRYTPRDGEINVVVSSYADNVVIEIEDSGPGIPEDMREKVFERFQQVNRLGVRETGGTGLGLSIVKEFVELHNGRVILQDSKNGGALLRVEFPLKAPEGTFISENGFDQLSDWAINHPIRPIKKKSSSPEKQELTESSPASTILIVDDNKDILDFITRNLSPNFLVATASNGKEGLEKAMAYKPDLIISDIMMPVMSGDEMVEHLREQVETAEIPVIMLTAVIDEQLKYKLLKESVQDYLVKPFAIEELQSKVDNITRQTIRHKASMLEAEHRYQYALDNMLEGCQIISHDWEYLYINDSGAGFGHKSKEFLTGRKIQDAFPDIADQPIYSKLKNCMENKVHDHFEIEFYFPDQSMGWYELSVHPIPEGIFILSVETSERRRAEDRIRKSEEELKKAQKIAGLGYWTWHIPENKLEWSEEMYRIFGIDPLTFDGNLETVMANAIHPDDRHILNQAIQSMIDQGVSIPSEYKVLWPDQSLHYVWAETGEFIVNELNKPIMVKGIAQDITQRKVAEQEVIRAKERAEESDRLKSSFLANMSHEVRTPMNAIMGFSELLSNPDFDDLQKAEFSKSISRRSYDLLHIIEDILDISKIEVGQLNLELTPHQIENLLNELLEFYQIQLATNSAHSNLSISLSFPAEIAHLVIQTDLPRLRQIFVNLIDNAIKFTKEGSIEFGFFQKTDTDLILFVRDSGIGIELSKQAVIFDRFRQAEEINASRKYGGSGLGLSIVKGILELMHCIIWIESELGKGATFYFNQALVDAREREGKKTVAGLGNHSWKNKTILVVEDDLDNAELITQIFHGSDVKLLNAYSGKEALDLCSHNGHIDLVLMDIRLPDINGLNITHLLKEKNPQLIIIAQTAYAAASDRNDCLEAGCNDYISKPIDRQKMFNLVNKYLS
ncbi:MAG TPA: ATP-binding protein, partial [Prolixibacteraceae bacterium]